MGKPKRKSKASVKRPEVKVTMNNDLVASIAWLKKVVVPNSLVDYKGRLVTGLMKLNGRIHAEAGRAAKTTEREAAKLVRDKAAVVRARANVERKAARAKVLQERIAKLQAQVKTLN